MPTVYNAYVTLILEKKMNVLIREWPSSTTTVGSSFLSLQTTVNPSAPFDSIVQMVKRVEADFITGVDDAIISNTGEPLVDAIKLK